MVNQLAEKMDKEHNAGQLFCNAHQLFYDCVWLLYYYFIWYIG